MAIEKILNKRSNAVVTEEGVDTPKKPTSSQLDNGEIAVNYHKGTERLFIKNDNDEVVEIVTKDEVDKKYDKVDGVNIVRKEFEDDYGPYTEGVVEIDNGVYNAMVRKNEIVFTYDSDKGSIIFSPIANTIDGKYFPGGVKCKHKKTDDPLENDLRIARMCDLPSVTPQLQSDWNENDTTSKSYILNKPTIPTKTSDLNNDSKFVSEDDIEPITSQFESETLITLSSYNYPDLNTAFISFVGTWEKATVSYNECYVNTARTFGINFSDTLSFCSNIWFITRLTKLYNGTTPVQVKCGDTVVYSYSLRSSDSVDTELSITNITNENGVFTVTFETFTTSSETVTLNGNELTIIIPEDANLRHNRFDPYSERIIYKEKSLSKQLDDVAFSGSYNDLTDTPTIPTGTYIVEHTTEETTIDALTPNVLHKWGTMASLTISALATPSDETIVNEYMIEFTSGSTATVLSLPSSIVWAETPSIEANATYQISVINNLGIIVKFS